MPSPTRKRRHSASPSISTLANHRDSLSVLQGRKRAASFTELITKLLPSHRPERGSTHRAHGFWEQSMDVVGCSPNLHPSCELEGDGRRDSNQLLNWNMAQEIPQRSSSVPRHGRRAGALGHGGVARSSQDGREARTSQDGPFVGTLVQHTLSPSSEAKKDKAAAEIFPGEQSRAQQFFQSRKEARRLRRNLKESGDFLGVQGVNPETGEMDVLTPTTTSSSTQHLNMSPPLRSSAQMVKDTKRAYREAKRQHEIEAKEVQDRREQEKIEKLEREKDAIRTEQRKVRWRKEAGQWSSVAEPNLSPIAQSQKSATTSTSAETIIHTPSGRHSPRSRQLPLGLVSLGLSEQEDKENRKAVDHGITKTPDTTENITQPELTPRPGARVATNILKQGDSSGNRSQTTSILPPEADNSFLGNRRHPYVEPGGVVPNTSRPILSLLRKPPKIPRRMGPSHKDTSPVRDSPEKLIDLGSQTPVPVSKSPNVRLPTPNLLDEVAEDWADTLIQDIGILSRATENQAASASTPTTTTTGFDRNQLNRAFAGRNATSSTTRGAQAIPTLTEIAHAFGVPDPSTTENTPPSPPKMAQSTLPSSAGPRPAIPMTDILSVRQLTPTKLRTERLSPKASGRQVDRRSPTLTPASPPETTALAASIDGKQLAEAMAREATQAALGRARVVSVRSGKVPVQNTPPAPPDRASDGTVDRSGILTKGGTVQRDESVIAGLGKSVGMAMVRFLYSYAVLIRPVFDSQSPLRRRLAIRRSTWKDVVTCLLCGMFLFGLLLVGIWTVRGVLFVSGVLKMAVQGVAVLLGM